MVGLGERVLLPAAEAQAPRKTAPSRSRFQAMADQISLVFLEVVIPVMGGEEALDHIKRIRPDVPGGDFKAATMMSSLSSGSARPTWTASSPSPTPRSNWWRC